MTPQVFKGDAREGSTFLNDSFPSLYLVRTYVSTANRGFLN